VRSAVGGAEPAFEARGTGTNTPRTRPEEGAEASEAGEEVAWRDAEATAFFGSAVGAGAAWAGSAIGEGPTIPDSFALKELAAVVVLVVAEPETGA
jgi:hypothetical protein